MISATAKSSPAFGEIYNITAVICMDWLAIMIKLLGSTNLITSKDLIKILKGEIILINNKLLLTRCSIEKVLSKIAALSPLQNSLE